MSRRSLVINQLGDPTREGFTQLREKVRAREEAAQKRARHFRVASNLVMIFPIILIVAVLYNVFF